jgi:hypothetical protein
VFRAQAGAVAEPASAPIMKTPPGTQTWSMPLSSLRVAPGARSGDATGVPAGVGAVLGASVAAPVAAVVGALVVAGGVVGAAPGEFVGVAPLPQAARVSAATTAIDRRAGANRKRAIRSSEGGASTLTVEHPPSLSLAAAPA